VFAPLGDEVSTRINLIVEVEPKEAGLLIGLIERLFKEWYVAKHEREESMTALVAMAGQKEKARKGGAHGDGTPSDAAAQAVPVEEQTKS